MKKLRPSLVAAAALLCLANAVPVFAQGNSGNAPAWGAGGIPNKPGGGHGAPGPLAGAGLPFLVVAAAAGAYKLIRRRRDEGRQPTSEEQRH
jgi:hypothetical protein